MAQRARVAINGKHHDGGRAHVQPDQQIITRTREGLHYRQGLELPRRLNLREPLPVQRIDFHTRGAA